MSLFNNIILGQFRKKLNSLFSHLCWQYHFKFERKRFEKYQGFKYFKANLKFNFELIHSLNNDNKGLET